MSLSATFVANKSVKAYTATAGQPCDKTITCTHHIQRSTTTHPQQILPGLQDSTALIDKGYEREETWAA